MSKTILIVDDDEVLGRVLSRVLAQRGDKVLHAANVAQALELAKERKPNLCLLDLCLPDGDGMDLACELRSLLPDTPLVLITAYPLRLRDYPEEAGGFVRVLTKPLDLAELRQVVE